MHNFNSKTVFKLFFFASFGCCKIITLKLNLSFCFGKAIHRQELTGFVQNSHFLRFLLLNSMAFTFIHLLANFQSPANCLSGLQVKVIHHTVNRRGGKQKQWCVCCCVVVEYRINNNKI